MKKLKNSFKISFILSASALRSMLFSILMMAPFASNLASTQNHPNNPKNPKNPKNPDNYNDSTNAIGSKLQGNAVERSIMKKIIRDRSSGIVYEIRDRDRDLLGIGGFAECYQCVNQAEPAKILVVKIMSKKRKRINSEAIIEPTTKESILRESAIMRKIDHPHIIKFHQLIESKHGFYCILDFCENGDLLNMIANRGTLTEAEVQFFGSEILSGLTHLHRVFRVIHRDLKLENLLLDRDMHIKIADFGFAKVLEAPNFTCTENCGSLIYAAPEILKKKSESKPYSFEADNWSFAVTVYALLMGRYPFDKSKGDEPNNEETRKSILACQYTFPQLPRVSLQAQDFIQNILKLIPGERLTLEQMQEHPFLSAPAIKLAYIPKEALYFAPAPPPKLKTPRVAPFVSLAPVVTNDHDQSLVPATISLNSEKMQYGFFRDPWNMKILIGASALVIGTRYALQKYRALHHHSAY